MRIFSLVLLLGTLSLTVTSVGAVHVNPSDEVLPTPFLSGFSSVGPTSDLFWVFTPADACIAGGPSCDASPTVVVIQGGPGCSISMGLFFEFGPWKVENTTDRGIVVSKRDGSWTGFANLLFFDSPPMTGFSRGEIPTSSRGVGVLLHKAISELFADNGALGFVAERNKALYLFGESWSGLTIPQLTTVINEDPNFPMNLKGIGIGDGLSDAVTQVQYHADFSYATGLINGPQKTNFEGIQNELVSLIEAGSFAEASSLYTNLTAGILELCGWVDPSDIRYFGFKRLEVFEISVAFLNTPWVMSALGVPPNRKYSNSCNGKVGDTLAAATMQSVADLFPAILDSGVDVLLYTGMYDFTVTPGGVYAWVSKMAKKWLKSDAFDTADRIVWKINGATGGMYQAYKNLALLVAPGGHMLPMDNPTAGYALGKTFVTGGSWNSSNIKN